MESKSFDKSVPVSSDIVYAENAFFKLLEHRIECRLVLLYFILVKLVVDLNLGI